MALTQLAGAMDVDVMAGATDPANHALPQQPLHSCLLPGAVSFPTLHRHGSLCADLLQLTDSAHFNRYCSNQRIWELVGMQLQGRDQHHCQCRRPSSCFGVCLAG